MRVFDDADKHKLLTLVAVLSDDRSRHMGHTLRSRQLAATARVNFVIDAELVHEAILATSVIADVPEDMKMEGYFSADLAFSESLGLGRRMNVRFCLAMLLKEVLAIITDFEKRPELFRVLRNAI